MPQPDAVVIGSGPNGLAAAVTLARAGLAVQVLERLPWIGGAAATRETTLPGFLHDLGSAVHPLAVASPFFRRFRLTERVRMRTPALSYASPLGAGRAAVAWRDLDRTVAELGADGPAWRALLHPLVERADAVARFTTGPLVRVPADPAVALRFGLAALEQGGPAWNRRWAGEAAPALLAGVQAHAIRPLPGLAPSAAGLALAVAAHARGWPIPEGGSGAITAALALDLAAHGGTIETGVRVDVLPEARIVLFDTAVADLLRLARGRLPWPVAAMLRRVRSGAAVAKVDFALDGPVPWLAPVLGEAGTVHLGGTRAQVAASLAATSAGRPAERPVVLVAQPSVLDASRAPTGRHVLWAYAHAPLGSTADPTERITAAIEREAPGFRDRILAAVPTTAAGIGEWNSALRGGDIAAGATTLAGLVARPLPTSDPWHLGRGVYLCSAASSPGPGVHGMAGYLAARSALRHECGIREPPSLVP